MKNRTTTFRGVVMRTGKAVPPVARPAIGDGRVRVSREVAGRGGKGVTVVTGLALPPAELEALAAELKRLCGAGGAVREGRIEIQGEHRDRLVEELQRRGHAAKRAGG